MSRVRLSEPLAPRSLERRLASSRAIAALSEKVCHGRQLQPR
jgi:hypothetical protein